MYLSSMIDKFTGNDTHTEIPPWELLWEAFVLWGPGEVGLWERGFASLSSTCIWLKREMGQQLESPPGPCSVPKVQLQVRTKQSISQAMLM